MSSKNSVVSEKEALVLVELLQFQPTQRDDQILDKIAQQLENVKFLQQYSSTKEYKDMLRYLELEEYPMDQILFKQGDTADKFYIILRGCIGLYINVQKQESEILKGQGIREIAKLYSGDAFGELGLLLNEDRTATAVCVEKCQLLSLNKQIFEKYLKNAKNEKLDAIRSFYESLWSFRSLTPKDILKISTKTTYHKCDSNTIIIRQGEKPKGVFFVRNGIVKIIQTLKFRLDQKNEQMSEDFRDPSPNSLRKKNYKTIDMELDELGNGNIFCDYEVFNDQEVNYNVITSSPSEILTITLFDLRTLLKKEIYEEIRENSRFYPPPERIKKQFLENLMWKNFKTKAILHFNHSILNDYRDKTKSRLPYLNKIDIDKFQIYDDIQDEIEMQTNEDQNNYKKNHKKANSSNLNSLLSQTDLQKNTKNIDIYQQININPNQGEINSLKIKRKINFSQQAEKMIQENKKRYNSVIREQKNLQKQEKSFFDSSKSTQIINNKYILPKINPRSNIFNLVNQIY